MRASDRRTRLLASFAVVALSALVPGPVTAGSGTSDGGVPGASVLIRMLRTTEPTPAPAASGAEVAAPRPERAHAEPEAAPEPNDGPVGVAQAPEVTDDADPATFVRDLHVLHVDTTTRPADQTFSASSGGCPRATTCPNHQLRPARWPADDAGDVTIGWRFNDEGRRNLRAPSGLLESAVRAGMAEWSRWNSRIGFVYEGTTTAKFGADGEDGSCSDGVNTVTWERFDPSVIAAVVTCTDPAGRTIRDADLAMNVTQHWEDIRGEPDSRHSFDIVSIVTHELGHWLSLLDMYDADSRAQTMMGASEYGENRKRTLALGDIIGLQTAYPCGDGDSCPRDPIVDD